MNESTISLLEIIASGILVPAVGYIIYVLKDNRERNKKQAELADERDKKIKEVLDLSKEQALTLAKQDEVLKNQSKILEEQSESLEKQDEILELHTSQLEAVTDASREELAKSLEEMHALFVIQGYVTSAQLKDFEKKYKVYHDALGGNGAIERYYNQIKQEIPLRDDLQGVNLTLEICKQTVGRSRKEKLEGVNDMPCKGGNRGGGSRGGSRKGSKKSKGSKKGK